MIGRNFTLTKLCRLQSSTKGLLYYIIRRSVDSSNTQLYRLLMDSSVRGKCSLQFFQMAGWYAVSIERYEIFDTILPYFCGKALTTFLEMFMHKS